MGDKDEDDYLTFDEFLKYCHEHEKNLWLTFRKIDRNNSGMYETYYF